MKPSIPLCVAIWWHEKRNRRHDVLTFQIGGGIAAYCDSCDREWADVT